MQIIHKIDDFLFTIFPKLTRGGDNELIIHTLENYYTYGPYKPKVTIAKDWVTIEIDTPTIISQEADYKKTVVLCEKGKYSEAKPILKNLIQKNPANSEYHRIMGQILSDEGDQEEAINCLIDALRWDPKNGYALIMMGNIFARHKDDIDTAIKYYNEAIAQDPKDHIAINNLGTNLLQLGKWEDGIKYLETAYGINPNYPNTLYGLALANEHLGNTLIAFERSVSAMKKCGKNDSDLFNHALALTLKTAEEFVKTDAGKKIFNEYKSYLEIQTDKAIKVEVDNSIPTAAKIEFAENYNRDYHLIKYKEKYLAVEHLMMHELVHLDFAHQARKEETNKVFVSSGDKKNIFIKNNAKTIHKLNKDGYSEDSIASYMTGLYEGINLQIFNTPIDLFIEDFLYENYQELRLFQFISLYSLLMEGKDAVTHKKAASLTPGEILSASKILNLVNALHFKDIFGYDLISKFEASQIEIKEAVRLFDEFKEYRKDKEAGEEYELVQHWGDDLKLDKYFELIDENEFRNKRTNIDSSLTSIEKDPFGLEVDKEFKKEQTNTFLKSQKEIGINMAVVMFMVDAMQYFQKLSPAKVKEIALEIAMLGTQGINPASGNNYKLYHVPNKDFSGYHLLAYYYVSWSQAIPEMVDKLNLPYAKEYALAQQMFNGGMK